ncbi:MAG TPA: hypothetical protein VLT33_15585 [Labilithrix sp.]|nr:hypothetical protein [Labilithrix sp.]
MVAAAALASAGCRTQSLPERGRFVEDGVAVEALGDWQGEPIVIDNTGVLPTGGLSIAAEDGRARISAIARLLALRDTLDKPGADDAIVKAKKTFLITSSLLDPKTTSVVCGAVNLTSGNDSGKPEDDAGCDALDVSVPPGTPERPLRMTARSGNGKVGVSLGAAVLAAFDLTASRGPIDVAVPSTPGAAITIVAATGDDVVLRLPRDFAADAVTLETGGAVDTLAFPDVQSGRGRGVPGAGAKSITVRTATGRIVLLAQ